MIKKILFLLCSAPLLAFAQIKEQADAIVLPYLENNAFSGTITIAQQGKIIYQKTSGFRDFTSRTPLKKTDLFELASVSKQFTAMVIMLLQEKGQLQFDDPVEKYLDIPYKNISIRHLLTHTSGLPDYQSIMDQHWDKSMVANNDDILNYLRRYAPPTRFVAGSQYEYSNTGYVLLASIAEKASGRDFTEICRTEIFQPLGMKDTDLRTPAERSAIPHFAKGHIADQTGTHFLPADSFPSSNYTIWLGHREGPGRISSTTPDLLKWDAALRNNRLIKKETLNEAYTPMLLNDGQISYYGFGWDIFDNQPNHTIVGHNGDNPGYKTQIIRSVFNGKTLIVLSNNAPDKFDELIKTLQKLITE
jgi:CubicO group peptidase (beta-lactamase class C family)